jgi:hypothetical protein
MTWTETRFSGDILDRTGLFNTGRRSYESIVAQRPTISRNIQEINYNNITEHTTIVFQGAFFLEAGNYQFEIFSDDGVRVFIDGVKIIDRFDTTTAPGLIRPQPIPIQTSGLKNIKIDYFNHTGPGVIRVKWEPVRLAEDLFLDQIIQFDASELQTSYVKGTNSVPTPQNLTVTNTDPNLVISVGFETLPGVIFTPQSIVLQPKEERTVEVSFNPADLENYVSGLTVVNTVATLAVVGGTTVIPQDQPTVPPPQTPPSSPTNQPPPPPVTGGGGSFNPSIDTNTFF